MKKILIIGCPGSGKSTLARALHGKLGLTLHHLDMMYWNADGTKVERAVFLERLFAVLREDEWIVDGNYASTMELRLSACDTVIFLDYPTNVCLEGVSSRRGKVRSDIPWVETHADAEFIEYVKRYNEEQRPKVLALLDRFRDKRVIVLKSRGDAEAFLQNL